MVNLTLCIIDRIVCSTYLMLWEFGAACCVDSLFVFVALRPKSTAMVIAGRSVHLSTLISWAGLNKRLTSNLCTYFACN